nr:16S rRNA (guanine(966)-N(2))-methyltransferase RsmD [Pseudohoeflea sp. DP4N28-3]
MRRRVLLTPKGRSIRPTSDRTRESLFNILEHGYPQALDGARMLDLFAGTGAVGCEALSRGCAFVLFVERGAEGEGLIGGNLAALSLTTKASILRRDATRLGARQQAGIDAPFDFVFADPPYGKGLGERALASLSAGDWLAPGALVILEERANVQPGRDPAFAPLETRDFGDTRLWFFRYDGT